MAPAHTLLVLYSLNQARGEWSVGGAVQSATVAPTSLNLTNGGANAATGIRARFLRLYLADPSVYVVPSPNATEGPSPPPPPPTPLAPPQPQAPPPPFYSYVELPPNKHQDGTILSAGSTAGYGNCDFAQVGLCEARGGDFCEMPGVPWAGEAWMSPNCKWGWTVARCQMACDRTADCAAFSKNWDNSWCTIYGSDHAATDNDNLAENGDPLLIVTYQRFVTTYPPPLPPAAPTPEMPLPPGLPMFALRELSVNSCALSEAAVAPTC